LQRSVRCHWIKKSNVFVAGPATICLFTSFNCSITYQTPQTSYTTRTSLLHAWLVCSVRSFSGSSSLFTSFHIVFKPGILTPRRSIPIISRPISSCNSGSWLVIFTVYQERAFQFYKERPHLSLPNALAGFTITRAGAPSESRIFMGRHIMW